MAGGGVANGVTGARLYSTADRRRLLILPLCSCRQEGCLRHLRHVTGRGARGKAEVRGRRAPTRGSALVVVPERRGGIIIRQAAGHGQVADFDVELHCGLCPQRKQRRADWRVAQNHAGRGPARLACVFEARTDRTAL